MEIVSAAVIFTHAGTPCSKEWKPPAVSAMSMTPIVFWASWRPCPSAIAAAETVWAQRKRRIVRW